MAQALSGFLSVVVDADRPRFLGPALADAITGIYASYGVLGALLERAAQRAAASWSKCRCSRPWRILRSSRSPRISRSASCRSPRDRPRLAQAYILRTADGRLIAIHLSSLEKFWLGLVDGAGAPTSSARTRVSTTRLARIDNYEALGERTRPALLGAARMAEWCARLQSNDVPFAPINGIDAVVEDPQVAHLGLIVPVEALTKAARRRCVRHCSSTASEPRTVSAAPLLDQHGATIRAAVNEGRHWPAANDGVAPRRATGSA